MAEDRSLDDFLDSGNEQETSDEASATGSETATDAETDASAAAAAPDEAGEDGTESVIPATTTYAWDEAGAPCAECGATVTRRWEQDGSLVCSECKAW